MILIDNVVGSTNIFIAIFLVVFLLSIGKQKDKKFFSVSVSQELKGFAILVIVFSHIGYSLSTDHRFLFPLSIMAGVGVNLFLLLSGYGLTMSALRNNLSIDQFYRRRLPKLFIPFWLVIFAFFLLDFFILKRSYDTSYIINSIFGIFPRGDLSSDLDSPLWYFTLILFYYLLFPLIFHRKYYWLSALMIYAVSFLFVKYESNYFFNVIHLYKVHLLAFPLGIILAGICFNRERMEWVAGAIKKRLLYSQISYYLILFSLVFMSGYFAYYSNVGGDPLKEELASLLVSFAILEIFLIKKVDLKLFSLFGFYSYEVYLLHWPIVSRYDLFYKSMPGWLATVLYLVLFIFLGWLLQKLQKTFVK